MKKIIVCLFIGLISTSGFAQDNAIAKYFSKYQDDTSFTKISVSSKMFSLFAEIDPEDEDEKLLLDAMSKLKGIKALGSDTKKDYSQAFQKAWKKIAKDNQYEELVSFDEKEEQIRFLIREKNGTISELLMLMRGKHEFMIMTLYGEIDLKSIAKLSRILNIKGFEQFQKLGN